MSKIGDHFFEFPASRGTQGGFNCPDADSTCADTNASPRQR